MEVGVPDRGGFSEDEDPAGIFILYFFKGLPVAGGGDGLVGEIFFRRMGVLGEIIGIAGVLHEQGGIMAIMKEP